MKKSCIHIVHIRVTEKSVRPNLGPGGPHLLAQLVRRNQYASAFCPPQIVYASETVPVVEMWSSDGAGRFILSFWGLGFSFLGFRFMAGPRPRTDHICCDTGHCKPTATAVDLITIISSTASYIKAYSADRVKLDA